MQRIVTGKGPDGSPAILFEGEPPTVVDFGKYVTTELWVTDSAPPPGGSCFRIVRIAPDDAIPPPAEEEDADFLEAHATATLDYVTVLSGEVTLVVGDREVRLGPGDSVVQQGVAHDWQNRGSEPCVLVGVLLSGM